jgi:hypothetical protein
MSKKYYEKWFSDFLYIKNIRDEDAYVIADDGAKITIPSGGVLVLNFGRFTEGCKKYSIISGVSLHQKYIDICEKLGWNVEEEDDGRLYLSQYSPAGEDFGISVDADNIVEDVGDYYDTFNPDDHAYMWYGRNNGEPSSLRDLLDDAEAIDNMLKELYDALNK